MSEQPVSFLDCWRSLPNELKLSILRLVLTFDNARRGLLAYHHIDGVQYCNQHPVRGLFIPLASIPEIKSLVLDAFYTQNKFLLEHDNRVFKERPILFRAYVPPRPIPKLIRRLHFSFWCIDPGLFDLLRHASRSFHNLNFLEISFHSSLHFSPEPLEYLDTTEMIKFSVRKLRVVSQNHCRSNPVEPRPLETAVMDKFGIESELGLSTTTSRRFFIITKDGSAPAQEVAVGSALPDDVDYNFRWSVKEVNAGKPCTADDLRELYNKHLHGYHPIKRLSTDASTTPQAST
jgi:hypothetical protein